MGLNKSTPLVGFGESGRRVGQSHHRARISDAMVETVRALRENAGLSYTMLCWCTGLSRSSVQMICTYQRRNVRAVRYEDADGKVRFYG